MRPIRNDGTEGPLTWQQAKYSRDLTQELIDPLYCNGVVQVMVIGFNDPHCIGRVHWDNHDNHLHCRFYFEDRRPGYPVVRLGTTGSPAVNEVQRRLNNWLTRAGRTQLLTIDGEVGQNTYDVAVAFKRDHGVAADGVFGHDTWKASLADIT